MAASEKVKVYKEGTEPAFPAKYDVVVQKMLNYTDISGNSNKFYKLELQIATNGQTRLYTVYGRVGAPKAAREYRMATDRAHGERLLNDIVKSKTTRKSEPYQEVDMIKSDVGSEVARAKAVEASKISLDTLNKIGVKLDSATAGTSKLHPQVQNLVTSWFGSTSQFIEANLDTKKCPLGQLSFEQIAKGKDILDEARKHIHGGRVDITELNKLTSLYYSNIPHVLPHRIDADLLRFDSDTKIDKCFDILDVFADAKNIQNVLTVKSDIDSKYATLNTDIEFIDAADPIYMWVEKMVLETRASNHHFLGKIKVHRIFKLSRHNEEKHFISAAEKIAVSCGKMVLPDIYKKLVPERPDIAKEKLELYKRGNILPLWHGTRRANLIGISRSGLLIRPSGVPHAGSMFGDGIYWADSSSKSINYVDCNGSYWAGNNGNAKTSFLFLADVCLGNQKIVSSSGWYTKDNIRPNDSVWAKKGVNLVNNEFITYVQSGNGQQHLMRYVIEFETQAR